MRNGIGVKIELIFFVRVMQPICNRYLSSMLLEVKSRKLCIFKFGNVSILIQSILHATHAEIVCF